MRICALEPITLLRVIWTKGVGEHPDYIHEKLIVACKNFSSFFSKKLGDGTSESMITEDEQIRHMVVMFMHI